MPLLQPFSDALSTRLAATVTVSVFLGTIVMGTLSARAASDSVIDNAMHGVVAIYKESTEEKLKPSGTGFFITPDGYLLTAFHVVDQDPMQYKGATFKLLLLSGKESEARLIARSEYLDVAILRVVPSTDSSFLSEIVPLVLKGDSVDKKLTILGNPSKERGKLFDRSEVSVSDPDRVGLMAVSPDEESGYSGGPAIDATGAVVGIALQQSEASSVSFVRKVDTLNEFLEANGLTRDVQGYNGLVMDVEGYEKHLSLSALATTERVMGLEQEIIRLKDEEKSKQELMDDLQQQLWRIKSQVQWNMTICELSPPPSASDIYGGPQVQEIPVPMSRHKLVIEYDKVNNEIMFDAKGTFAISIVPMISGESLADADKREGLTISRPVTFNGQAWIDDELDGDLEARVQTYNATMEHGKEEVDTKKIVGFAISLVPPKNFKDMQYFRFSNKVVSFVGLPKCGLKQ